MTSHKLRYSHPMLSRDKFEDLVYARSLKSDSVNVVYKPEINDLYWLYCTVRERAVVSVLEYGSGWSTLALALAVHENFQEFGDLHGKYVRFPNPFQVLTLDASSEFLEISLSRLTPEEKILVRGVRVEPTLTVFEGSLCVVNSYIPNFVPDLIYLDGPDHNQVKGQFKGFTYDDASFTPPISADLLMLEPFLWPETIIVTDGRTANSRFLEQRLKRSWQVFHDPFGDRTMFRLAETPFGLISEEHINFRLSRSREIQDKESPER